MIMITISNKMNGFCSVCNTETEDARAISFYGRNDSLNRIIICERHLKQLGETISTVFKKDGEQK